MLKGVARSNASTSIPHSLSVPQDGVQLSQSITERNNDSNGDVSISFNRAATLRRRCSYWWITLVTSLRINLTEDAEQKEDRTVNVHYTR